MATPDPTSSRHTSLPSSPDDWRLWELPPSISLFAIAGGVGLVMGVIACLLKHAVHWVSLLLVSHFHPDSPNWALLVIPVIGIMLVVAFQKIVVRRKLGHGVDQIEDMVNDGNYDVPTVFSWGPLVAALVTLGFGGSAGAEGPIASSGSTIGSLVARRLGLPPRLVRILIGCGAGAGIAGIFKAPIGGMMFTVEVIGMELATVPLVALVIACLVSGMTCYAMTGFTLDVPLKDVQTFDPSMKLVDNCARDLLRPLLIILYIYRHVLASVVQAYPGCLAQGIMLGWYTRDIALHLSGAVWRGL